MTGEELLARAADLLEREGWCQGVLRTREGHHCMLGALEEVGLGCAEVLFDQVIPAITAELGGENLVRYNDTFGRTAEEVITTLRNAKRWL